MRTAFLISTLFLCAACSSETTSTSAPVPTTSTDDPYMAGTIELSGRLAEASEGAIHVVVSGPPMATPFVVKCDIASGRLEPDGTRRVPFEIHKWSGMRATEIPREAVPATLELKASFTPTGYVEQIERWQDVVQPIHMGEMNARVVMEPREAPASRPTSRPANQPVGGPTSRPSGG